MQAGFVRLFGGVSVMVAVVSIFSTHASATAVCYDPWESNGTPVGPVCGDIKVQGGGDNGPMAVLLDHPTPVSGATVENSGGGGGGGQGALVTLSGTYGTGHIKATAFTPPQNGSSSFTSSARGYIGTIDGFTVGANNLNAQFSLSLEGAFQGAGRGEAILRLQDMTTNSFVIDQMETLVNVTHPTVLVSQTAGLSAGHSYLFTWGMAAIADARVDFLTNRPDVAADLSGTGHLFIDVLTAGESLTFTSGHNYATNAVTPIPAALPLFVSGLGVLGVLGWRRKKRAA